MADEMALYGFSASTAQLTENHHVCLLNLVCYLFDIYFFIPARLYKPTVHVDTIDTPICVADWNILKHAVLIPYIMKQDETF